MQDRLNSRKCCKLAELNYICKACLINRKACDQVQNGGAGRNDIFFHPLTSTSESHPKTEEFSKKPLVIVLEWGCNENCPWVLNVQHQNPTEKLNNFQRNCLSMSLVVKLPLQVPPNQLTPNRNITVTISSRHHTTVRSTGY